MNAPAWVSRLLGGSPADAIAAPPSAVIPTPAPLFDAAVQHYLTMLDGLPLKPKTVQNKRDTFRYFMPDFCGRPVDSIRPFEIGRIVRSVHDAGKLVTARVTLSVLREIFNESLMMGWVDINPAMHVKRPPAPVRRQRLSLEQFQRIHDYGCAHFPPWFPLSIRLALVTGQRRSDLVKMRFGDVHDGHLFVTQFKTGARVAIPLALRLDALGCTLGSVIDECRSYPPHASDLLLRTAARPHRLLNPQSLTTRFWTARRIVCPHTGDGTPPSFHEIRSLSERLYRAQGVDTQTLLGHKRPGMTDLYNDERGLNAGKFKFLKIPDKSA